MVKVGEEDKIQILNMIEAYGYVEFLKAIAEEMFDNAIALAEGQNTQKAKRWTKEADRLTAFANSADTEL